MSFIVFTSKTLDCASKTPLSAHCACPLSSIQNEAHIASAIRLSTSLPFSSKMSRLTVQTVKRRGRMRAVGGKATTDDGGLGWRAGHRPRDGAEEAVLAYLPRTCVGAPVL